MAEDVGNGSKFDAPKPGSASAAAHATATAAVKAPEFQVAAAAAHGQPAGVPAEPDEPEIDETHPADPEGTSPSSAPSDDDDEPELSDDYDPEEQALPGEEDEAGEDRTKATDAPKADAAPTGTDDVERTWEQYKTDDERKKALAANKKYGIEQAANAKRLQAELDAYKAGKTTEAVPAPVADPVPTDPAEGERKVLAHLFETDPKVNAEVTRLGGLRTKLLTRITDIDTLRKETDAHDATLNELRFRLKFLQEGAKEDPDNFELSQKVGRAENEITRLETVINSKETKLARLEIEKDRWEDDFVRGRNTIEDRVKGEVSRSTEEARSVATLKVKSEAAVSEWETSFPVVMDELKINEKELGKERAEKLREKINNRLLRTAKEIFADNPDARITDVRAWMKHEAAEIVSEYDLVRDANQRAYVAAKKADAAAPAPRGAKAVAAPAPKEERLSAREADRKARDQMKAVPLR